MSIRHNSFAIFGLATFLFASVALATNQQTLDRAIAVALKEAGPHAYRFATPDLNSDSVADAVVLLSEPYCGSGGCTMLIFEGTTSGYRYVSRSTITREPIYLLSESTNAWRTLVVTIGGGGVPTSQVFLRFDGTAYPLNPTLEPIVNPGALDSTKSLDFQSSDA